MLSPAAGTMCLLSVKLSHNILRLVLANYNRHFFLPRLFFVIDLISASTLDDLFQILNSQIIARQSGVP
jgi:hypothetical protein